MTKDVQVECVICHRISNITSFNPEMYSHPIIKNNYVCVFCETKITKFKVILTCKKCKQDFHTKILLVNKDKYSSEWECPFCVKPEDTRDKRKKSLELNCSSCKEKNGVCVQPDLSCSYSAKFVVFGGASELYATKKECTVLSIHSVDSTREDIHTFKYTMLCNAKYLVATCNVILMKQRVGSKKSFVNKIGIYKYECKKKNFILDYEHSYPKGSAWIVPTRNRIGTIIGAK